MNVHAVLFGGRRFFYCFGEECFPVCEPAFAGATSAKDTRVTYDVSISSIAPHFSGSALVLNGNRVRWWDNDDILVRVL